MSPQRGRLNDWLSGRLDRKISREELAAALGLSTATLSRRRAEGFPAAEIITAAQAFGLSPTQALVDLGVLDRTDVAGSINNITTMSERELLDELLVRQARR